MSIESRAPAPFTVRFDPATGEPTRVFHTDAAPYIPGPAKFGNPTIPASSKPQRHRMVYVDGKPVPVKPSLAERAAAVARGLRETAGSTYGTVSEQATATTSSLAERATSFLTRSKNVGRTVLSTATEFIRTPKGAALAVGGVALALAGKDFVDAGRIAGEQLTVMSQTFLEAPVHQVQESATGNAAMGGIEAAIGGFSLLTAAALHQQQTENGQQERLVGDISELFDAPQPQPQMI
ncbi:MAG TPA: hypothetical protein VD735_01615 [Candidatus Saccharimonadales bacterium]|nr:hypothetical protein [Candidatus Saccharimonadales bacterium]